jgi:hypothetical protein
MYGRTENVHVFNYSYCCFDTANKLERKKMELLVKKMELLVKKSVAYSERRNNNES